MNISVFFFFAFLSEKNYLKLKRVSAIRKSFELSLKNCFEEFVLDHGNGTTISQKREENRYREKCRIIIIRQFMRGPCERADRSARNCRGNSGVLPAALTSRKRSSTINQGGKSG